jgi:hypothetical protein
MVVAVVMAAPVGKPMTVMLMTATIAVPLESGDGRRGAALVG